MHTDDTVAWQDKAQPYRLSFQNTQKHLVGCHFDVLEHSTERAVCEIDKMLFLLFSSCVHQAKWLQPNWIYEMHSIQMRTSDEKKWLIELENHRRIFCIWNWITQGNRVQIWSIWKWFHCQRLKWMTYLLLVYDVRPSEN